MNNKIKIGIVGYGNLGKGVELCTKNTEDMEVVAVFSRRDPSKVNTLYAKVEPMDNLKNYLGKIDVCILCGGSANDLAVQGPYVAKFFNTVDSFDTHAKIPEYFESIDKASRENNHLSMISTGWDPGLFSLNRVIFESVLPKGSSYTFWGKGVSQGHSDAIRRIEGVLDARQYTVPIKEVIDDIKSGNTPHVTSNTSHKRVCYVVAKDGADTEKIKSEIIHMPNYFEGYDTTVNFISQEELDKNHKGLPHGGKVIRLGSSDENTKHVMEFSLDLQSNPHFTASVNIACARAVYKLNKEGKTGGITIFDVAPKYYSPLSIEELRKSKL